MDRLVTLGRPVIPLGNPEKKTMQKFVEYRRHAAECRALAQKMPSQDQRKQLIDMAENWDRLALERERSLKLTEMSPRALSSDQIPTPTPATPCVDGTSSREADSSSRRTSHEQA